MRHHAAAYTNSCSPVAGELENAAELAERRKALRARRKDHRLSDRELRQDARDLRQDKQASRQDKREERFASRSEGYVGAASAASRAQSSEIKRAFSRLALRGMRLGRKPRAWFRDADAQAAAVAVWNASQAVYADPVLAKLFRIARNNPRMAPEEVLRRAGVSDAEAVAQAFNDIMGPVVGSDLTYDGPSAISILGDRFGAGFVSAQELDKFWADQNRTFPAVDFNMSYRRSSLNDGERRYEYADPDLAEGLVVVGNIWALGAGAAALGAGAWWLSRRYATPAPAPAPAQVVVTEQPTAARIIIDEPATLAEQARALRKTDRGLRQASRAFAAMADDDLDEVDDLDEQILADEAEAGARASLDEIETEGLVHIGNIWGT